MYNKRDKTLFSFKHKKLLMLIIIIFYSDKTKYVKHKICV